MATVNGEYISAMVIEDKVLVDVTTQRYMANDPDYRLVQVTATYDYEAQRWNEAQAFVVKRTAKTPLQCEALSKALAMAGDVMRCANRRLCNASLLTDTPTRREMAVELSSWDAAMRDDS